MSKKIIVAIDGYSSCGKSSMARALARAINYIYVDTGAMYRGVTLFALRQGFITADGIDEERLRQALPSVELTFVKEEDQEVAELYLNGTSVEQEIRSMEVAAHVSPIASLGFVREFLTDQQRATGLEKGIVMDGRDIGTAVFPNAELKIFVTADPVIRAERRLAELRSKGNQTTTLEEVLENLRQRDYLDTHREVAPLRQAEDAIVLDNSHLTIAQQDEKLLQHFNQALAQA